MTSELIRGLKAALNVQTDVELARALNVERSTVAQWKRRGGVPQKYLALMNPDTPGGAARFAKGFNAIRHNVLGRSENHYYLRAALAFMSDKLPAPAGASRVQVGVAREYPIIRLMNLAQTLNMLELGRRYCQTEAEYEELVSIIERNGREAVDRILTDELALEVPQASRD